MSLFWTVQRKMLTLCLPQFFHRICVGPSFHQSALVRMLTMLSAGPVKAGVWWWRKRVAVIQVAVEEDQSWLERFGDTTWQPAAGVQLWLLEEIREHTTRRTWRFLINPWLIPSALFYVARFRYVYKSDSWSRRHKSKYDHGECGLIFPHSVTL